MNSSYLFFALRGGLKYSGACNSWCPLFFIPFSFLNISLFHCQQGGMGFALSACVRRELEESGEATDLHSVARRPHTTNPLGFLTGVALFLAGNENAVQEGDHICCMQPYICTALHGPCLTWMLLPFQTVVCPSPSCQECGATKGLLRGYQGPTSSLRISWHWE